MSGCGALGGGGDLRAGARAGRRRAVGVVGAVGGAGRAACCSVGACRGARAAAEARLAQLVAAAEPRSPLARQAGTLTRDGSQAGRPAGPSWAWAAALSDRAGDGGGRSLAGALQLRPRLRRGRARSEWGGSAEPGGGVAAACGRDQRAPAAAALLSRVRP